MTLCFDIETYPLASSMALPYPEDERTPPANYKSEEAIAKWREADRERWEEERVKRYSLSPRLGRVAAIAYHDGSAPLVCTAHAEADEPALVADFWGRVGQAGGQIAGWNSVGFDLPFLMVRSLKHGVTMSARVPDYLRRYSHRPHFDCKMALLNWPSSYATGEGLDEWAAFFGIAGKSGHGSEVYAMVTEGRWDDLERYATGDIAATRALVDRIGPAFGVQP